MVESKCPRVSQVFQEGPGPFLTNILVRFCTQYLRTSKFDRVWGLIAICPIIGTIVSNFIGTTIWSFKDSTSKNPKAITPLDSRLFGSNRLKACRDLWFGEVNFRGLMVMKNLWFSVPMVPESCSLGYVFKYDIIWSSSLGVILIS